MHAYVHGGIRTCMHSYIVAYIHTFIHTCSHFILTCVQQIAMLSRMCCYFICFVLYINIARITDKPLEQSCIENLPYSDEQLGLISKQFIFF